MRRIRLLIVRSDGTVAKFDLAIEREVGAQYEAGVDDYIDVFWQGGLGGSGGTLMRLYIRDGKKATGEDINWIKWWIDERYVPEMELLESLKRSDIEQLH